MSTGTRVCNKCKKDLPLEENFDRLSTGKDFYKKCKACVADAKGGNETKKKASIKNKKKVMLSLSTLTELTDKTRAACESGDAEAFQKGKLELEGEFKKLIIL
jgi:hypothetical protein